MRMHGKGDNNILILGEVTGRIREEILLVETHIDQAIIQHEDERVKSCNFPHQHL